MCHQEKALLCVSSPRHVHNIQSSKSSVCWLPLFFPPADISKHELFDIPKWEEKKTKQRQYFHTIFSACLIMAYYRTISYKDTIAFSTWEGCHWYHPASRIQLSCSQSDLEQLWCKYFQNERRQGGIIMEMTMHWLREKMIVYINLIITCPNASWNT